MFKPILSHLPCLANPRLHHDLINYQELITPHGLRAGGRLLAGQRLGRALLLLVATSGLILSADRLPAAEAEEPSSAQAAAAADAEADADVKVTGEAIYRYCQACHGEKGAGGEGGKYPRIAGLPSDYIAQQLHDFKSQRRVNKPMIPIFKHHRFDETVITLVAEHIAGMPPPGLALWPYQPSPEAIAAYGSKQALADAGAQGYQSDCASCHAEDGLGKPDGGPPLLDQYPAYLAKQIGDFAAGHRQHAASERCGDADTAETEALIHYLVELGKD
jgi:cytochrome c553